MATVILGALGAGIGAATGGAAWVAAAWKGFQIGATVGSMIDAANAQPDTGQLSDRTLSDSSYGNGIPMVWGSPQRIATTIIWAATDSSGNVLVEHTKSAGKGGMLGGSKEYWYSASFACAVCCGQITLPDGSTIDRHVTLKRIWADDLLIYDKGADTRLKLGDNLIWYSGSEGQSPDSLIVSDQGVDASHVASHPGVCYPVIESLDLSDWGQRVPNIAPEVETDAVDLADVASDLMRIAGIPASRIDVSAAVGVPITGLAITERAAVHDALVTIASWYGFELVNVDGKATLVSRGAAPVATIPWEDLGASTGDPGARVTIVRANRDSLPSRIDVKYNCADTRQSDTASAQRQTAPHDNLTSFDLPIVVSRADAIVGADHTLDRAWVEADTFSFVAPSRWMAIAPGDVVLVETAPTGDTVRCRLTRVTLAPIGEVKCESVLTTPETAVPNYTGAVAGGGGGGGSSASRVIASEFVAWSGVALQDSDQETVGFYCAANGLPGWRGGEVYWSADGSTWVDGGSISKASPFGSMVGVLADGAAAEAFDVTSVGTVQLVDTSAAIVSSSDAEIAAGQGYAMIGEEVVGVGVVDALGDDQYHVSRLYRGARSSPMTGHADGERFIALSSNVVRVDVPTRYVGSTLQVRVVSVGQSITEVDPQVVTIAASTSRFATSDEGSWSRAFIGMAV